MKWLVWGAVIPLWIAVILIDQMDGTPMTVTDVISIGVVGLVMGAMAIVEP